MASPVCYLPLVTYATSTEKILRLASDKNLRDRLSAQAQVTVRREREWSTLAARYVDIYACAGAPEPRPLAGNHCAHPGQEK